MHGVRPGAEFAVGRHSVRVIETHHKVPSVGYCVAETRRAHSSLRHADRDIVDFFTKEDHENVLVW